VSIPSSILDCAAVRREINFSTKKEISSLSLVQRFLLNGLCIENWSFQFGYCIPNSTNTWQQVIQSARGKDQMMKATDMSGKVIIDTCFYDKGDLIYQNKAKVYYVK
jgi:retinal rod rhodopsin-sensitive cGMP 3',5'-cyclic phosphodiesterase subunit delta